MWVGKLGRSGGGNEVLEERKAAGPDGIMNEMLVYGMDGWWR